MRQELGGSSRITETAMTKKVKMRRTRINHSTSKMTKMEKMRTKRVTSLKTKMTTSIPVTMMIQRMRTN